MQNPVSYPYSQLPQQQIQPQNPVSYPYWQSPQPPFNFSLISQNKRGSKKIIIILVIMVVIILAIIGIVVGLYFALRKKSSATSGSSSSGSSSSSSLPPSSTYGNTSSESDFVKCRQISPSPEGTTSFEMLAENISAGMKTFSFTYAVLENKLIFNADRNKNLFGDNKFFSIGNYGFKASTIYYQYYCNYLIDVTILFCSNGKTVSDVLTGKERLQIGQSYPVKTFYTESELYSYFGV